MKLLNEILDSLPQEPVRVERVIVGVHATLVKSRRCGLGSTLLNEGPHGHAPIRDVGALEEKSAQELASWVLSENLLEASIGIAALNSLLEPDESRLKVLNAAEILGRESQGKNLAIVGHFPFIERLRGGTQNCWVIEKRPSGDEIPAEKAGEVLPLADVVAITGTTLINHSLEGLLASCRPDAFVMVLGPSTPMAVQLFEHGITVLSGSQVSDEEAVTRTIQQGASFPQMKGVRLVNMTRM